MNGIKLETPKHHGNNRPNAPLRLELINEEAHLHRPDGCRVFYRRTFSRTLDPRSSSPATQRSVHRTWLPGSLPAEKSGSLFLSSTSIGTAIEGGRRA